MPLGRILDGDGDGDGNANEPAGAVATPTRQWCQGIVRPKTTPCEGRSADSREEQSWFDILSAGCRACRITLPTWALTLQWCGGRSAIFCIIGWRARTVA